MDCRHCRHWQGNRYTQWADCNWVIGILEPKLFEETNDFELSFRVPFDPHDVIYFSNNPKFCDIYHSAAKVNSNMDSLRVERKGKLRFIKTREDHCCGFYEEK